MEKTVKRVTEIRLTAEELAVIIRDHLIDMEGVRELKPLIRINFEGYQNTASDQPQITAVNVAIETRI